MNYEEKKEKLLQFMKRIMRQDACIAFSGGVDSSLLLVLADKEAQFFGKKLYAITMDTVLHPKADLEVARKVLENTTAEHLVLREDELEDPAILNNPKDRCYLCKKRLYQKMIDFAKVHQISVVMEGTNRDDLKEYRPGLRAIRELGIISPLAECGFTKEEVRKMAEEYGIIVSQRPSTPCLATRLPYNTRIQIDVLRKIEDGENYLRELGFGNVRMRVHGDTARLELDKESFPLVLDQREKIIEKIKNELGFRYVVLDLEGFRSGSMDL